MKAWFTRLVSCPLCIFTQVSLILITSMVIASSYTQSRFFQDALIEREAEIVKQTVITLAHEHLRAENFVNYTDVQSQLNFDEGLSSLKKISGVVRLKLYNSDDVIVWSDAKDLVGKRLPQTEAHRARVWAGISSGVFDPTKRISHSEDLLPRIPLIEFYVPITVTDTAGGEVKAVVAIYRSAKGLTDTLRRGMVLLWLVAAIGGSLLFFALFYLFRSIYRRKIEVENQFYRLSTDHERIVQMEKLSTMGRMVGEIAHQFNNPLVGVINLTQLAEREADKPERVRELLGEIRKAGEHCRGFVQRMLKFTQLARSEPQPTEIAGLVRDTIGFFAQSVAAAPRVEFAAPDSGVVLQVDPVLLHHALFNLINNAAQADPSGPIGIELSSMQHEGIDGWAILVTDRGPGLSAEVMKHLFTPFYTTRKGGTGLGLSVAQFIVIQLGGRLYAGNNPEGGARFVIWLPLQADLTVEPQKDV